VKVKDTFKVQSGCEKQVKVGQTCTFCLAYSKTNTSRPVNKNFITVT
jgi:hypothetical protein